MVETLSKIRVTLLQEQVVMEVLIHNGNNIQRRCIHLLQQTMENQVLN